ncbi:hypothetical protein BU26DRAFT_549448 [Trematosphaeria pertusa]|uniref:Heterokaryon incompatibility domain-containing protein n=1 Tax=Trematosphaeria pertusa TaxID=390896 RepID=A0A6A6IL10_9PLEO|nr:uncharacterized protein BU26DRAFT_549448 [Trematosphaeria pertusa]KAF2250758.1 hypothetical protein BU26DRAFT_549448 [Trematosphaeria pertusa]
MVTSTIADFLEAANQGRLSPKCFLEGCIEIGKETNGPTEDQLQPTHLDNELISSAVPTFSTLISRLNQRQVLPKYVLNVRFPYTTTEIKPEFKTAVTQLSIYCALQSLVRFLEDPDGPEPVQFTSEILAAMHFSYSTPSSHDTLIQIDRPETQPSSSAIDSTHTPDGPFRESPISPGSEAVESSLGAIAENILQTKERPQNNGLSQYGRALDRWNALLDANLDYISNIKTSSSILSIVEVKSLRILLEWQNGKIFGTSIPTRFLNDVHTAAVEGREEGLLDVGKPPISIKNIDLFWFYHYPFIKLWLAEFYLISIPTAASERTALNRYRQEACIVAATERVSRAVYYELCQDIGVEVDPSLYENGSGASTEKSGILGDIEDRGFVIYENIAPTPGYNTIRKAPFFPYTLPQTISATSLSSNVFPNFSIEIAIPPENADLGAMVASCPWLAVTDVQNDLPHFLWDRKNKRTVVARDLSGSIQYTAISHTWGRWRKKTPGLWLPGVQHWQIPENTKFEVADLPDMLTNVPTGTEYIWFDLLCIPQDPRTPDHPQEQWLKDIAKREIGRQAQIFRRAKVAIAWLNDIENWDGMRAVISRIGLQRRGVQISDRLVDYLKGVAHLPIELGGFRTREQVLGLPPLYHQVLLEDGSRVWQPNLYAPSEDIYMAANLSRLMEDSTTNGQEDPSAKEEMEDPFKEYVTPLEACEQMFFTQKDAWDEMNPWFSSLWTLQEVCVCPQMRMCTKGWDLLEVGPRGAKLPIGFDDLVALSEAPSQHLDGEFDKKVGFVADGIPALSRLLQQTGLQNLLHADRSTILAFGNQRYCQENRAEAIMSAIGVTEWFKQKSFSKAESLDSKQTQEPTDHDPMDDFQTSEYPEAFLTEAATKLGALFYASNLADNELMLLLWQLNSSSRAVENGLGSMFPFASRSKVRNHRLGVMGDAVTDHPSVKSWRVCKRCVYIREAGIISYTGQIQRQAGRGNVCVINGPFLGDAQGLTTVDHGTNLDMWVDRFLPATKNYAVCLVTANWGFYGILLKELSCGSLIKVGTFTLFTEGEIEVGRYSVDWRVL